MKIEKQKYTNNIQSRQASFKNEAKASITLEIISLIFTGISNLKKVTQKIIVEGKITLAESGDRQIGVIIAQTSLSSAEANGP